MRTTRDVDVVALLRDGAIVRPEPFPESLRNAAQRVASDFDLPDDWLNAAPRSLLDFGLPDGFASRLVCRDYGSALTICFAAGMTRTHDPSEGFHQELVAALAHLGVEDDDLRA